MESYRKMCIEENSVRTITTGIGRLYCAGGCVHCKCLVISDDITVSLFVSRCFLLLAPRYSGVNLV